MKSIPTEVEIARVLLALRIFAFTIVFCAGSVATLASRWVDLDERDETPGSYEGYWVKR